ncbi:MAG: NADP oxidoreductase [Zetaproteobacteria bacterium]|nr:MAG: NADP oxidoreductase [Zetaproteobacteria bacterium]
MPDAVGFVGIGNIASAVVEGLANAPGPPPRILLSPRNAARSAALALRFPTVAVAESNQAVLDGSGTVFLSLRPQVVTEALRPLRFHPCHTIVSLIPLPVSTLAPFLGPARRVLRALLLPTCTQRLHAVPYWPETPDVRELLERLGPLVPLTEERELDALWASTAVISAFYAFLETVSEWSAGRGVPPTTAVDYTAGMAHALARVALSGGTDRFARLAAEAATPGGLNEQVMGILRAGGAYSDLRKALDAVLARMSPPTA